MEDMGKSMEGGNMAGVKLEMEKVAREGGKSMSGMDMGDKGEDMNMPNMKPSGGQQQMPGMQGDAKQKDMTGMKGMPDKPADQGIKDMPNRPGMQVMNNMPGFKDRSEIPGSKPVKHGPDKHGIGNQSIPELTRSRLDDPGIGLEGE